MSTPVWTPGPPWKPERWTKERWGTWDADAIKSADGHVVAMVVRHDPSTGDEQLTANAHIVATAPELYNALFQTQQILQNTPHKSGDIIDYRIMRNGDVLAKARGESR